MTNESIKKAVSNIEKKFGKGSIIDLEGEGDRSIQRISSGSLSIDTAIGGGYPRGRIIEIYGPESSGKSTIILTAIREVQRKGGVAAYLDLECAFDSTYAENLGVDLSGEKFIFAQPGCGEEALEIIEELVKTGAVDFIGVDSVSAMIPKAELEGDFGESKMGLQARLMSQGMRKLVSSISKSNCIVFFTNQLRSTMGDMYGPKETTTGGNALKFYASVRIDIRKSGPSEKDKDGEMVANKVKFKVTKNKTYPPFKEVFFYIIFGEGISAEGEVVDIASDYEIIKKSGSWYSYGDTKLGQGREAVISLFKENKELYKEISSKVRELFDI